MSEDLIKREDAIEAVHCRVEIKDKIEAMAMESAIAEIIKNIANIPSADRPQGEWRSMGEFERCSICDSTHLKEFQSYYGKTIWIKTPYCPYCGAKMKGADDCVADAEAETCMHQRTSHRRKGVANEVRKMLAEIQ